MSKSNSFLKRCLKRWQPEMSLYLCIKSGIKGMIAITALAAIGHISGLPLIIAPFAATCITVFTTPNEEFAQPINIVGGYFIAGAVGLVAIHAIPHQWWVPGLTLAATISIMAYFRTTHPPAGAVPFLFFYYHQDAGFDFLIFPTMAGCFLVVLMAMILHGIPLPKARTYPRMLRKK